MRILVVEDEALIALHTEELLLERGHTIVGPADRVEIAMELARYEAIDAAILDVNLAGYAVWPVAEILQARNIGFMLLSGFSASLEIPLAFKTVPSLSKPVQPEELFAVLEKLVP